MLHALVHSHRKLDLIAAHVDHQLQPHSAETAQKVAQLASGLKVTCHISRVDVGAYRKSLARGWSVQQAARAARYQALADVVQEHRAAALLVAHTADDQAETLLQHLLRGSGLNGLTGMRLEEVIEPRRLGPPIDAFSAGPNHTRTAEPAPLRLVRPLLRVNRSTTLAYCTLHHLAIVEDTTNQSRAYTRNRVRLDLMPALEQFNPAIRTVLARTAELAAEDDAALDSFVAQTYADLNEHQTYRLDLWRAQHRAVQRRLLRASLNELLGELVDIADAPVEDALDLLQTAQPNQTYHLPYGVELCVSPQSFSLQLHGRARPRVARNTRNTWETDDPRV